MPSRFFCLLHRKRDVLFRCSGELFPRQDTVFFPRGPQRAPFPTGSVAFFSGKGYHWVGGKLPLGKSCFSLIFFGKKEGEIMNTSKERIRGVPRQSGLSTAAAAVLLAAPIVDFLLEKGLENYFSSSSISLCLLSAACGALFLLSRNQSFQAAAATLLLFTGAVAMNAPALLISVFCWILSSVGIRFNQAPAAAPEKLRLPLFNLIAAAMAVISFLTRLSSVFSQPTRLIVLVLVTAGSIALNLSVEAQSVLPTDQVQQTKEPGLRYRSIPRVGLMCAIGALCILAHGVQQIIQVFRFMSEFGSSGLSIIWPLMTIVAGVLLLLRSDRSRWILPAAILLLIPQLQTLLSLRRATEYMDPGSPLLAQARIAALLFFSLLLLLISAVGTRWNAPVAQLRSIPMLSLVSAALAAVSGVWSSFYQIRNLLQILEQGGQLQMGMLQTILLGFLLELGLVLLNLSMEGQGTTAQGWKVDGGKYRRGFSGFVSSFYSNVGGKLQLLAKINGFFCLILGLLGLVVVLIGILVFLLQLISLLTSFPSPFPLLMVGAIMMVSALLLAICTWPLYAFGQMVNDVHDIRTDGTPTAQKSGAEPRPAAESSASEAENPDELPEL